MRPMANDELPLTAASRLPSPSCAAEAPLQRPLLPSPLCLLRAMRPRQWTKNGIVFLALVFSVNQEYQLGDPDTWMPKLLAALVAFVCFCLVSGADYLVNDIRDIESDRAHPRKRRRPIAAGLLPVHAAWAWAVRARRGRQRRSRSRSTGRSATASSLVATPC